MLDDENLDEQLKRKIDKGNYYIEDLLEDFGDGSFLLKIVVWG